MSAREFSALVWPAIEKHRLTADQAAAAIDACSDDLAIAAAYLAKAQHLREREAALEQAIDAGWFESDPYSTHAALTEFKHSCGKCVARVESSSDDGESITKGWVWWRECSVAMEGVKDE